MGAAVGYALAQSPAVTFAVFTVLAFGLAAPYVAMATAGGLVFCGGTRDLKIRAFDKDTGDELWQYKLPYGGYAPPATYEVNARQYIVIAATGGGKLGGNLGDAYVAFALHK
jgi:quinoprotein glucose dehydrogenase